MVGGNSLGWGEPELQDLFICFILFCCHQAHYIFQVVMVHVPGTRTWMWPQSSAALCAAYLEAMSFSAASVSRAAFLTAQKSRLVCNRAMLNFVLTADKRRSGIPALERSPPQGPV